MQTSSSVIACIACMAISVCCSSIMVSRRSFLSGGSTAPDVVVVVVVVATFTLSFRFFCAYWNTFLFSFFTWSSRMHHAINCRSSWGSSGHCNWLRQSWKCFSNRTKHRLWKDIFPRIQHVAKTSATVWHSKKGLHKQILQSLGKQSHKRSSHQLHNRVQNVKRRKHFVGRRNRSLFVL